MKRIIYTTIVLIFTTLPIFAFNPLVKYHKKPSAVLTEWHTAQL